MTARIPIWRSPYVATSSVGLDQEDAYANNGIPEECLGFGGSRGRRLGADGPVGADGPAPTGWAPTGRPVGADGQAGGAGSAKPLHGIVID